tara:strand:+ start:705 stop:923 length:219 start_codon:yes stop_codon:yes gene_type:complete
MIPKETLNAMKLEDRFKFLSLGIGEGIKHLESLYGDFTENIDSMDANGKEFMHGYTLGLIDAIKLLIGDEEE